MHYGSVTGKALYGHGLSGKTVSIAFQNGDLLGKTTLTDALQYTPRECQPF